MKVLSLYNGISCGYLALQRAGIPVERYVSYEIDQYAIGVSKRNVPIIEEMGDVIGADFAQYHGFDILMGGSPCTYWSICKIDREVTCSGVGWELFMHYNRALVESGCKYFLYENNNRIHRDIQDAISKELGVQPIMINSALVSAQNRKRLYWTNIPGVTQPEDKCIMLCDVLEDVVVNGVDLVYKPETICVNSQSGRRDGKGKQPSLQDRIYSVEGKMVALTTGYHPYVAVPVRLRDYERSVNQSDRVYSVYGKSVNLCANGGGGTKTGLYKVDLPDGDYVIRKLTAVEAERLQTLPDNWTAGMSNAQRYKCCGNGWTVDAIAHILSFI